MNDLTIMIPGLAALGVLLWYYFTTPRLPIKLNRIFLRILITEVVVLLSEGFAVWVNDHYFRSLSPEFLYIINVLFYLSYVFRGYQLFAFSRPCFITTKTGKNVQFLQILCIPPECLIWGNVVKSLQYPSCCFFSCHTS